MGLFQLLGTPLEVVDIDQRQDRATNFVLRGPVGMDPHGVPSAPGTAYVPLFAPATSDDAGDLLR